MITKGLQSINLVENSSGMRCFMLLLLGLGDFTPSAGLAPHRLQEPTFVSSCIIDPAAHTRPDEAALGTLSADDLSSASSCQGSTHPRIWYSSLADLSPRIDPYSVVIGSARRSEFQSKLACPLEGLRRVTRRERHGSGYVRQASASRGGKHG
jgi:hypothetical protein